MPDAVKKYDIVLVNLNPTRGSEQRGIRPCLVLQNNEANKRSQTTVIAIFSSVIKYFPHTMVVDPTRHNGLKKKSRLDLLQIRTIDRHRVIKKLGMLDASYRAELRERFEVSFDLEDLFE